jgi:integrase
LTVNEVLVRFWAHAEGYYRHLDGTPTSELDEYRLSLKPLKALYGHTLARDFGPLALKAVRQNMIDGKALCRRTINARTGRIKRAFKWATSEQLIPPSVYHGLQSVAGLGQGRTTATDPEPVAPIDDATIEKTLRHLTRHVRGIIQFMRLTGARPSEACMIRPIDIDTTADVWRYRPERHKTSWRGKARVILIGPKAQAILNEFPVADPTDYIFSPRRSNEERYAAMRSNRVTAVQPSQLRRRKPRPKRPPGARYNRRSLYRAIMNACDAGGIPHWHPNQLRHTRGTEVRKSHGLEAAQVVLGHADAKITEVYAESDTELAARVAMATG